MTENEQAQGSGAAPEAEQGKAQAEAPKAGPSVEQKTRRLERENKQLQERLSAIEAQSKTETEKAIEAARVAGRKEVETLVKRTEIGNAITLSLMGSGLTQDVAEDLAIIVQSKHGSDIDDVASAKQIAADYAKDFMARAKLNPPPAPPPTGQGGAPSGPAGKPDFSRDAVSKMTPEEFKKQLPAILEARQRGQ